MPFSSMHVALVEFIRILHELLLNVKTFRESCPFSKMRYKSPTLGREVGDDRQLGEWRGSSKRVLVRIAKRV